jgi:hypothetical protein
MKTRPNWIIEGLIAGVIFLAIKILIELLLGEFSLERLWITVIAFLIAGLGYGLTMKFYSRKRK